MADVIITESGVTAIAQTVEGNIIAQGNDVTNIMQSDDTTLIVQEAGDTIIEDSEEIMIVEVQDSATIIEMEPGVPGAPGEPGEPGTTDYNELDNLPDLSIYVPYTGATSDVNLNTKNLSNVDTYGGKKIILAAGSQAVSDVIARWSADAGFGAFNLFTQTADGGFTFLNRFGSTAVNYNVNSELFDVYPALRAFGGVRVTGALTTGTITGTTFTNNYIDLNSPTGMKYYFGTDGGADYTAHLFTMVNPLTGTNSKIASFANGSTDLVSILKNGDIVSTRLRTGFSAPLTTGTTKMLVSDTTGLISFADIPTGGSPGGSNTNVQINDSGAFYGDSGFTYDKTAKKITVTKTSLGTTPTDAVLAENTTAATSGNQQVSPAITRTGQGYGSSSSQAVDFRSYVLPVQGTPNPSLIDKNQFRINGGTWTDAYWYDSLPGGQGFAFYTPSGQSNGAAGTTRIATFNNTGTNTWLDFNFTGTRKSSLGADNQGQVIVDSSSNNGLVVRINGTANHYLGNGALLTYGYGGFQSGINAGSTNVNTSTLQSSGGLALKVKKLTVSGSLDNSATHWLLDGTNSFSCSGTPTYSCSHWANESECLANDAHGGPCAWSAGSDCSAFNNEFGMGSCLANSPCSASSSSCVGPGDEATCLAQDDYYGGDCAWNPGSDCSAFNSNEAGCSGQTGCYISSYSSCSSQYDEGSCNGVGGCYWDGMTCTGDNSTCAGTYGSGCSGSFYTGACTGTYGSGCSGTSSCSGINDSTSCTAETGCTSVYVINGNLPDGELYPDRTLWAVNDSSTNADAVLLPASGQTINMTTSLTLSTYKDGVHLAYYKDLGDCSIYNSNESTCGSTSGCTQGYIDCAGYTDSTACTADTHCSWNGASCDGGVYFSNCSGSYVIAKNWYIFGRT